MILRSAASLCFCTSLERRSAACSCFPNCVFPLPSIPWQSTHLLRKMLEPGDFAACWAISDEATTNVRIASQPTNLPDFAFTRSTSRDLRLQRALAPASFPSMIYESFPIPRPAVRYNLRLRDVDGVPNPCRVLCDRVSVLTFWMFQSLL